MYVYIYIHTYIYIHIDVYTHVVICHMRFGACLGGNHGSLGSLEMKTTVLEPDEQQPFWEPQESSSPMGPSTYMVDT